MRHILTVIRFFDRQPKRLILLLAFASLASIGTVDALTGHETAFGFLYLVPISFTAWHLGLRWGVFISVLCAAMWAFATASSGDILNQSWTLYWPTAARLVVFLSVTLLVSALRTAQDRAITLTRTDTLTGAANTRWFREQLDREILRCRRYRHPFTVIYGDLDHFKTVNDRLGHAVGDALLRDVAESLQRGVRRTDIVARVGGDEFAILLPETGQPAAHALVQQLREGVLDAMRRYDWPVTASFGVVTCVEPPGSADTLLDLADRLMYAAKREGKGGVRHAVLTAGPAPDLDSLEPSSGAEGTTRQRDDSQVIFIPRSL